MNELTARIITCVIEAPIAYMFIKSQGWPCRGPGHAALAAVVGTCLLHPPAWDMFLYLRHMHWNYWEALIPVEALVYLTKALLIGWMIELPFKRAIILSTMENTASAGFGVIITLLGLA